ncbi:hypothetical protein CBS101457_004992 [Exobasidium rhododendri]|nr:hypothetical protein CBS101457_004992 [Exobasidium rhododendri]
MLETSPLAGCALTVAVLLLLTIFITPAHSFWIMSHKPLGFNARLDPIISPGNISSHLHSFVGSNAISDAQNYSSIRASSACTTSGADADKSSYWTPTLFRYADEKFTAFNLSFIQTYYLQRGPGSLLAFPAGLRMVAGNATATGPASTTQLQKVVNFVCLNYDAGSSQTDTIPNGPCPDGLRAQIVFPSCWDGINLDSIDHKSHMAYPVGDFPDNGDSCPSSHPKRLITLFYEFVWSVGAASNAGNWVLANGDAVGYSFHGDFMNGWDVTVLQAAIDQCTGQLFNDLEGCPPFAASLDRKGSQDCVVDTSMVKGLSSEVVSGALDKLPGCNTIFNGALKGRGGCSASQSSSSSSSHMTSSHSSHSTKTILSTSPIVPTSTSNSTSKKHDHHTTFTKHHHRHSTSTKKHHTTHALHRDIHKHTNHHSNKKRAI